MIKVLIIDDEPLARLNLRQSIEKNSGWKICGELNSGIKISQMIQEVTPDVIFLDIDMPGEDGLSIAQRVLKSDNIPMMVFVTAYNEYAVDAFEVCAFDYILKPFNDARLKNCLNRIEHQMKNDVSDLKSQQAKQLNDFDNLQRIVIRSVGSIEIINTSEIHYIKASGNYVEIYHNDGVSLHRSSLSFLENRLNQNEFIRIHRSSIVKIDLIKKIEIEDDHIHYLKLVNHDKRFKISASYKASLFAALKISKDFNS